MRADQVADIVREHSSHIAVEVTTAFLERHPDWRARYGAKAMSAGVQDAGYHLAFLAAALELDDPRAFAAYARWAGRVLAARGIGRGFLIENLEQVRDALTARLAAPLALRVAGHFQTALSALVAEPDFTAPADMDLTANLFLQAIVTGQRHAAVQIAKEALGGGLSLEELYTNVFQTALYEVGARWESNRLTVAQEHVATAVTQYVMAQLYVAPDLRGATLKGRVVLTGVEGELHNIGAVMVGDLLETAGYEVHFLGSNVPPASVMGLIKDQRPSHVGISTTMLFNLAAVRHLIGAIRAELREGVRVVVGGAAFRHKPDLWRELEADGYAADLRGVQAVFETPR